MTQAPVPACNSRGARRHLLAPALLVLGVVMSSCSSTVARSATTGASAPSSTTSTIGQSVTASPGSDAPPFQVAPASVEISGSDVTIKLSATVVRTPLRIVDAAFGPGHKQLTFSIAGLIASTAVSATGGSGALVAKVELTGTGASVRVVVRLRREAAHFRFAIVHNQVDVDLT
jgi:hypothetical protein